MFWSLYCCWSFYHLSLKTLFKAWFKKIIWNKVKNTLKNIRGWKRPKNKIIQAGQNVLMTCWMQFRRLVGQWPRKRKIRYEQILIARMIHFGQLLWKMKNQCKICFWLVYIDIFVPTNKICHSAWNFNFRVIWMNGWMDKSSVYNASGYLKCFF